MDPTNTALDLDETDLDIIRELERTDEKNLEEFAEELNLSKSTIHYRLNRLKENGVITAISADVDPRALGLVMVIITEVYVSHERGYAEEIGEELGDVDGVQQVYYTMGDVDFVIISRVQSHDQLNGLIDEIIAIEGVNKTSSQFVMRELKNDNWLLETMSDEMIDQVLDSE